MSTICKYCFLLPVLLFFFAACERKNSNETKAKPQVFEPDRREEVSDTLSPEEYAPLDNPKPMPSVERQKMPTKAELKHVTPSQEAKRELSADAMKAYSMKPDEFASYMKTRIPYYKSKGDLKAENDVVRIQITGKEMKIESAGITQTFPMQ